MKLTAIERRLEIIEIIKSNSITSLSSIARQLDVSYRTIRTDIEVISLSYPIEVLPGAAGGVRVIPGYRMDKKYFTKEQTELLKKYREIMLPEEQKILDSILITNSMNR